MSLRGKLDQRGIVARPGAATNLVNGLEVGGTEVVSGQGVAVADSAAITADALDITFTSNTPTPSETQTIADGTVPTVAELGQFAANQEVVCEALQADVTELSTQLNALLASLRTIKIIAT